MTTQTAGERVVGYVVLELGETPLIATAYVDDCVPLTREQAEHAADRLNRTITDGTYVLGRVMLDE